MVTVGIRELKRQTSQLIRRVRERGDEIQVTHRGKVVARIIPMVSSDKDTGKAWDNLDLLSAKIGKHWPKKVPASQAVREARR